MNKKKYHDTLDGIRALAIILVMLLHAHFQLGKGGGIGVQMFFVLSGYLITQSLFNQYDKFGYISLKDFWIKRIFRLLPTFLLMLMSVFLISSVLFQKDRIRFVQWEIINSLFYVSNISWFWQTDNFDRILGHTWSLSVENQFYLIWPIILIIILKYINSRLFVLIFSVIIILLGYLKTSSVVPDLFRAIYFEAIYFGCILSIVLRNNWIDSFKFENLSLLFLIFLLLIGFFKIDFKGLLFENNLVYLVISFITIIIILNCLFNPNSILSILLSNRILVFVGKISYSLYLWHLPIFRFFSLNIIYSPSFTFFLKFIVTFILSILSYFFLEKKIMDFYEYKFK